MSMLARGPYAKPYSRLFCAMKTLTTENCVTGFLLPRRSNQSYLIQFNTLLFHLKSHNNTKYTRNDTLTKTKMSVCRGPVFILRNRATINL